MNQDHYISIVHNRVDGLANISPINLVAHHPRVFCFLFSVTSHLAIIVSFPPPVMLQQPAENFV